MSNHIKPLLAQTLYLKQSINTYYPIWLQNICAIKFYIEFPTVFALANFKYDFSITESGVNYIRISKF